jgi:hypothetical protein
MIRPTRLAVVVLGLCALSACSLFSKTNRTQDLVMTGNPKVPGAQGNAKMTTTDDGNTQINLDVKHLAAPDKIEDGATVFVVWVQGNMSNDMTPQNLGALKLDSNEHGTLTAVTSMRSFDLYITAEPSPTATAPTGDQLLRTNVEMPTVN